MATKKLASASSNQVIAGSVLVVVVMVFVLILVGRSFIGKISHNSAVIGKKQKAESQLKTNLNTLPQLKQAYDSLGSMHDTLDKALPIDSHFPQLVASMEVLAGSSNVSLAAVSPAGAGASTGSTAAAAPAPAGSTSTIPSTVGASGATGTASPQPFGFSVQVKGSYQDILKFLSNLELSARPVTISNVQLSGTTGSIAATVSLTTYYYNPPVLQDKTEAVK